MKSACSTTTALSRPRPPIFTTTIPSERKTGTSWWMNLLFLPLSFDGARVNQILVYSHYEDLWRKAML